MVCIPEVIAPAPLPIEPNNPLYNLPRALRMTGILNVAALETALNGIVAHHEVLRTTYPSDKGQPLPGDF